MSRSFYLIILNNCRLWFYPVAVVFDEGDEAGDCLRLRDVLLYALFALVEAYFIDSCAHVAIVGTGRETPRGNSGDLGRAKKRKRRRWFSRKYYASVMRIKEFYEDNIGKTFTGILSNALDKNFGR